VSPGTRSGSSTSAFGDGPQRSRVIRSPNQLVYPGVAPDHPPSTFRPARPGAGRRQGGRRPELTAVGIDRLVRRTVGIDRLVRRTVSIRTGSGGYGFGPRRCGAPSSAARAASPPIGQPERCTIGQLPTACGIAPVQTSPEQLPEQPLDARPKALVTGQSSDVAAGCSGADFRLILAAATRTRTTTPTRTTSITICPVTAALASEPTGWMSPKPTVASTVTVK
jgi:hypothetical protein